MASVKIPFRRVPRRLALGAVAALLLAPVASADNFASVRYDRKTNQLVVAMSYRGTNPNHHFSLKWGECLTHESDDRGGVTAEVLDDQWEDAEEADYEKTTRFSLSGLPCPRPVNVTLRTAPRFFYTLTIP
jgi:hypothetical protein